jgi:DNA-binding transcriptional MerR regulator
VNDLISIGQFAALTSLSPKALRIYHEQGLLEPAVVDPDSGYRYYRPDQIDRATRIALMRRIGVSLGQIADHLAHPSVEHIDRWRTELDEQTADRHHLLDRLRHLTTSRPDTKDDTHMPTDTPASTDIPGSRGRATLTRAIPVLASLDLEATGRFYTERLGFEVAATYPDYLITNRDDIEIHFWLTDDTDIPKQTSCYVRVAGIDALYAEMEAAGVVHPNGPLTTKDYGVRDFAVLDGDGNLIKFGERIATAE